MDNIDSTIIAFKTAKKDLDIKNRKVSANSFKKLYQTLAENAIKRQKEEENRKKYRLSVIIQKLLAGIILNSDELQFLKENAPIYYNQAMRQRMNYRAKREGQHNIGEIDPINKI